MTRDASTISALLLDESDNVATVLSETPSGARVRIKGIDTVITASDNIPIGHKIATKHIDKHDAIIKYGQRIGRAHSVIKAGSWIHLHNIESLHDSSFRERIET